MDTYKIIRFYSKGTMCSRTIKTRCTLEEAEARCNDPKTRKEGKYFDGYTKE